MIPNLWSLTCLRAQKESWVLSQVPEMPTAKRHYEALSPSHQMCERILPESIKERINPTTQRS